LIWRNDLPALKDHLNKYPPTKKSRSYGRGRNIQHAPSLEGMRLRGQTISDLDLRNVIISSSNLRGVTFARCLMSGAVFNDCDMSGVRIRQSNTLGSVFRGCDLGGARFHHCQMDNMKVVQPKSILHAHFIECHGFKVVFDIPHGLHRGDAGITFTRSHITRIDAHSAFCLSGAHFIGLFAIVPVISLSRASDSSRSRTSSLGALAP